jgi:uncharacterized protein YecT (DUF1311 family)
MRAAMALALSLAVAAPVFGAAPKLNCRDPQSNLEMKLCAQRELERADAELNAIYAQATKSARAQYRSLRDEVGYESMPDLEQALRKAQRAWISFRDANCEHRRLVYYGGSMASLVHTTCKADMTKARVKELKAIEAGGEEPPQ